MESMSLPPIADVPGLGAEERAAILDLLFEPCTQLHTLSVDLLRSQTFQNYVDMISSITVQLLDLAESTSTSDTKWLEQVLSAHPRLGGKKVDSAQSKAEQAQLSGGGKDEALKLAELNASYEQAFPGLRYVVFVNGRSRNIIMDDMRDRIKRADIKQERLDAIKAMGEIAADRASKLRSE